MNLELDCLSSKLREKSYKRTFKRYMYNFQMPEDLKQTIDIIFTTLDKSGFLIVKAKDNKK